jgi:hypothetical protein
LTINLFFCPLHTVLILLLNCSYIADRRADTRSLHRVHDYFEDASIQTLDRIGRTTLAHNAILLVLDASAYGMLGAIR